MAAHRERTLARHCQNPHDPRAAPRQIRVVLMARLLEAGSDVATWLEEANDALVAASRAH